MFQQSHNPTISYNRVIDDLQNYMFTGKNIVRYLKNVSVTQVHMPKSVPSPSPNTNKNTNTNTVQTIKKIPKTDFFYPKQKDTLFWCFYAMKNGIDRYEMLDNTHFIVEKQEKFKYIELIRAKKDVLKMNKIRPITDLEDDLANKESIGIKTFIALAILEGFNIIILDNRTFFESVNSDDKVVHVVQRDPQTKKFFYDDSCSEDKIQNYKENYYKLDTMDKKIKAIGSYKLEELMEMAKKLGIDFSAKTSQGKKISKKDIYESIVCNIG
jgi:hypothetical protein